LRRRLLYGGVALVALLLLIQAVPYGRGHTNPPVTKEPAWDSAQTRALAARACFDCHSNLTRWPWYSNIAPMSWLTQRDVDGGRASLNFSEWDRPQDGAGDAAEAARNGSMPPWFYTLFGLHSSAKLSQSQRNQLADGLAKTIAANPPPGGSG
jgi:hypothetical protein